MILLFILPIAFILSTIIWGICWYAGMTPGEKEEFNQPDVWDAVSYTDHQKYHRNDEE